ncbi:Electron transfer flavoprotein alpha/beta-subunit [Ferroglobus placidus DSM 10642]|uniref:Electron transfer flavoprotein alpha/beta-subunit n=1 Tax=Ferroglobus placidus (strain DSM 10642 / AEDII12DO) TaxID=589924 RepID=D3RZC0_FERPA|nr:electron transfer flavoprotein subunit beta/FixA family protein [Ferroglobus placidus]ADC65833.1 Electron transfer flavoprotein alpha/beta-subunit [Ferroglobus placidus DSM 10642]
MNVAVCVKYAVDAQQVKFDPKTGEPLLATAPRKISDMDRRAIEEALRLKEKLGGKVVAFSVGDSGVKNAVKEIYAMGVDEVHIVADDKLKNVDTTTTAKILSELIKKVGSFDLILCGAASTDGYSWLVPGKIASFLELSFIPNAVALSVENGKVAVESDMGDGIYKFESSLPAVVSVLLEINEPRIPKLSDILKASKKKAEFHSLEDFEVEFVDSGVEEIRMPKVERKRVIFEVKDNIDEVVEKLLAELKKEGVL